MGTRRLAPQMPITAEALVFGNEDQKKSQAELIEVRLRQLEEVVNDVLTVGGGRGALFPLATANEVDVTTNNLQGTSGEASQRGHHHRGVRKITLTSDAFGDVVLAGGLTQASNTFTIHAENHNDRHVTGGADAFSVTDLLDAIARVTLRKNSGADVGSRRRINLIEGSSMSITVADDAASEEVDVTLGLGGSVATAARVSIQFPITGSPAGISPSITWTNITFKVATPELTGLAIDKFTMHWVGVSSGGTSLGKWRIQDLTNGLTIASGTAAGAGNFDELICSAPAVSNLPASCAELAIQVSWDVADTGTITVLSVPMLRLK